MATKKEFLTPLEAAKRLGVDRRTVYRWLREGELKADKIGGKWFVLVSGLPGAKSK